VSISYHSMNFHKLNTPMWPSPRWRNGTPSPSQKFPFIFPSSQSCPPLPTKDNSHLTSYCIDGIAYVVLCINGGLQHMLISYEWKKPDTTFWFWVFLPFVTGTVVGRLRTYKKTVLWLNAASYECTMRFAASAQWRIERCELSKFHSKSRGEIMGFELVGWQWGWRKVGTLERDLGVRIYRALIRWGDEEYRDTKDDSWVSYLSRRGWWCPLSPNTGEEWIVVWVLLIEGDNEFSIHIFEVPVKHCMGLLCTTKELFINWMNELLYIH